MGLTLHEPTSGVCSGCMRPNRAVRKCEDKSPAIKLCAGCWPYTYENPDFIKNDWVQRVLTKWTSNVIFFIIFEPLIDSHGNPLSRTHWS
jgi:hypothetical protein